MESGALVYETQVAVRSDGGGQVLIPVSLANELSLKTGDSLLAHVQAGKLVLEKREAVKVRLKERFSHLQGEGIVDEFISQRRLEAQSD